VALVEQYCRAQGLFRVDGSAIPVFSELLNFDLDRSNRAWPAQAATGPSPLPGSGELTGGSSPPGSAEPAEVARFDAEGGDPSLQGSSALLCR